MKQTAWENNLVINAMDWLTRARLGRSEEEKAAYLEAVADVLTAANLGTNVLNRLEGLFHCRIEGESQ